nr:recombinase family protein [Actinomyces procaprae]
MVEEYEDTAKTGRNMDRPDLQKMLAEVPTIRPAYLATWKVDRLGRDLMEIRHQLIVAGVRIHYIEGRPEWIVLGVVEGLNP